MAYSIETFDEFKADYKNLCSKNLAFKNEVDNKVRQIAEILEFMPDHFKPLRGDLAGVRRVHVASSFVLMFKVIKETKTIKGLFD